MKNNDDNGSVPFENEERDHIDELLDEEELEEQELSVEEELSRKLKDAEEKLLRQAADAENYRKRLIKETDDKIKYANQSLLSMFLPVLDNFDLAIQHGDSPSIEAVMEGVRLNQKVMLDTLEKVGLAKIDTRVGDPFDPAYHEAIMLLNDPQQPDNTVTLVVQNGYTLAGRVLRPAKVQVNKLNN